MLQELVYLRNSLRPDGGILPSSEASLSPRDRGFMFADGVYEVIRAYQGRLFHAREHLTRLQQSLDILRIPVSAASLETTMRELLKHNAPDSDATVYIQVTRGTCARRLSPPPEPLVPTVYIETSPLAADSTQSADGVSCILVPDTRWQRCDIKWLGLLPNVLARQQADAAGVDEAVFVRDGVITEGTHTSVFAVSRGEVMTHPLSTCLLAGITRQIVLSLCRQHAISVIESPIPARDFVSMDEMFLTCTTGEVIPVRAVDSQTIGDGAPGPITRLLRQAFRSHVAEELARTQSE
ncbi:MAG: aminotransferase class IV [candidate division WOR-3 bacterium]